MRNNTVFPIMLAAVLISFFNLDLWPTTRSFKNRYLGVFYLYQDVVLLKNETKLLRFLLNIKGALIGRQLLFQEKMYFSSINCKRKSEKVSNNPYETPCINLCCFSSNIALQWTCLTGGCFCYLVSCGLFHAKSDFPPMGGITTFAYFCSSSSSSIFPTFFNKKNMEGNFLKRCSKEK